MLHLPQQLTLQNGIKLLEVLSSPLPPDTNKDIKDIMSLRNYSYLEHGYERVSKETAQKILEKMEGVVNTLASKSGTKGNPLDCAREMRLEA